MNNHIGKYFGLTIRELRTSKKISQEKLAELSDLDTTFISMLENARRTPSLKTVFAIAAAFNMPAGKLVSLMENKLNTITGSSQD